MRRRACGCCRACGRSCSASACSLPAVRCRGRCSRRRCGISPRASPASPSPTARTPSRYSQWQCLTVSASSTPRASSIGPSGRTMAKGEPKNAGRFAYDGLDRVIHEKARLSVLTSLVAHPKGLVFGDLKQLCGLTDGNLSRHLQVLGDAKLIAIEKGFDRNRPQTVCRITRQGRARYLEYLAVLEQVVRDAADAVQAKPSGSAAQKLAPA